VGDEKREGIKYNAHKLNRIVVVEKNYFLIGGGSVNYSKLIWASLNGRVLHGDNETSDTFYGGDLRDQLRDYSLSKNVRIPWRQLFDYEIFLKTTINTDCNAANTRINM
jgi:hypothetical protein